MPGKSPWYEAALKAKAEEEEVTLDDLEVVDTMPESESADLSSPADGEGSEEAEEAEEDEEDEESEEREEIEEGEQDRNEVGDQEEALDDHRPESRERDDIEEDDQDADNKNLLQSSESESSENPQREEDGSQSLRFDGWTEERLEIVRKHFNDLEELSPEKRTEVLVNLAEAIEDGRLKFSLTP